MTSLFILGLDQFKTYINLYRVNIGMLMARSGGGGDSLQSTGVRGLRSEEREDWARLAAQHNTDRLDCPVVLTAHITHLGKLDLLSALTPSPYLSSHHITSQS